MQCLCKEGITLDACMHAHLGIGKVRFLSLERQSRFYLQMSKWSETCMTWYSLIVCNFARNLLIIKPTQIRPLVSVVVVTLLMCSEKYKHMTRSNQTNQQFMWSTYFEEVEGFLILHVEFVLFKYTPWLGFQLQGFLLRKRRVNSLSYSSGCSCISGYPFLFSMSFPSWSQGIKKNIHYIL
jgi:hypothetical protein